MIITLIGYMGSGKSSVAQSLSHKIQIPFIELDKEIERIENKEIKTIFKIKGEVYFRKVENKALNSILNKSTNLILSTGGGTPIFFNNMDLIKNKSKSFYLQASPITLSQRLKNEKLNRPLIAHLKDKDLAEFIAKHLFERNPYYQQADFTIHTDALNHTEVAKEVISYLNTQK